MVISRILGTASLTAYLLAMWLPSIASKTSYKTYLLQGWEAAYMSGVLAFAASMELADKAQFIVGTLANLIFLLGITSFLGRVFWSWSWPANFVMLSFSAASVVLSIASATLAVISQNSLLLGAYIWLAGPILLLSGNLNRIAR
jgi:hypothetical protein